MTRIRLEDFKKWYGDNTLHNLYHKCLAVAKYDSDAVTIDESKIQGEAFRIQFREWVAANPDKILPVAQPSYPELDALQPQDSPLQPAKPKPAPEQRQANIRAAQERYKYWVARGLLNTVENGTVIDNWFSLNEPDYSAAGLDRAIEANRAALTWYTPPATEYIPGTREIRLPLGTKPSPKHTANQLRDLYHREIAAENARVRAANTELAKSVR